MKKKVVGMLLCCVLVVSLAGCGKGQENAETKGEETTEVGETEQETTAVDDKTTSSSDALGGVYVDGDELTSIPMGTCIDGEQVDLINVEMPLNYIFGAGYIDADGESANFDYAHGNSILSTALESNFQSEPYAIRSADAVGMGNSDTTIYYTVVSNETFEDVKNIVKSCTDYVNYTESTLNGNDYIYYVDEGQYSQSDLALAYNINDDTYLAVVYKGPLAEKLGIDQLAENICNLITVIE